MNESAINKSYAWCRRVIMKHSKSFYAAFSLLPEDKANAVYAIYAFCRSVDDVIDEHNDLQRLDLLEQKLKDLKGGVVATDGFWPALAHSFDLWELPYGPFFEMVEGQRLDAGFSQPSTVEELERYCYLVAGTVGLMLLPLICDRITDEAKQRAVSLGIAMQLTNILRDVGEDKEKGRTYFPEQMMAQNSLGPDDLCIENAQSETFISLWEELGQMAEARFDEFLDNTQWLTADAHRPVVLAARIYREILGVIRERNYDVFSSKPYVPALRKQQIISQYRSPQPHSREDTVVSGNKGKP